MNAALNRKHSLKSTGPYPEQETEELGDEVIARLNPETGNIENMGVLFFSTRLLGNEIFKLPCNRRYTTCTDYTINFLRGIGGISFFV